MAIPETHDPTDVGLVFVAHNNHDERCGSPPRLRNLDNRGLYYGYFENRYGVSVTASEGATISVRVCHVIFDMTGFFSPQTPSA